jgi:hypothetical protein
MERDFEFDYMVFFSMTLKWLFFHIKFILFYITELCKHKYYFFKSKLIIIITQLLP